jgi:selenide,water dikinase
MDSSIMPTKFKDISLVQTTDFFYPLVDDPYQQGRIACANVLSDLYAMGVSECDNMLMLLAVSRRMSTEEKEIVTKLIIKGFNDLAKEAGTLVTGGQTVQNPWCIIGGVASAVVKDDDIIKPFAAVPGDVIILTKPLGTQLAVNSHQWLHLPEKWERVKHIVTEEDVIHGYQMGIISMTRLNKIAAQLMHKHHAHAATDVTGFGILGHANNLSSNQKARVDFEIHTLPILAKMKEVNSIVDFKLLKGFSSETSGGLLICLSEEDAHKYCEEIQRLEGYPAWIIGRVIESTSEKNQAHIIDNPNIIEVDF